MEYIYGVVVIIGLVSIIVCILLVGQQNKEMFQDIGSFETPRNCEVSDWSAWSTCDKMCSGGSQTRTRTITKNVVSVGIKCPALTESQPCNTHACTKVSFTVSPSSTYISQNDLFSQNLTLKVVTTGDSAFNIRNSPGSKILYHWNVRTIRERVIVQNSTNNTGRWGGEERRSHAQGNLQPNGSGTNYLKLTPLKFTWIKEDGSVLYEYNNRFNTGQDNDRAFFIETSQNISVSVVIGDLQRL